MERIHYVHVTICSDTPYYEEYDKIFAAKAIETPEDYESDQVEDMDESEAIEIPEDYESDQVEDMDESEAIETPEDYESDQVEDMDDVVDREIKEPASKVIKGGPWIASNTQ